MIINRILVEIWIIRNTDEISDRKEQRAIANWQKSNPRDEMAENFAELCSCSHVLWKVEIGSAEMAYL